MPRTIDLDARRAQHDTVSVTAGGKTFDLPPFLPASVSVSFMKLANAKEDPHGAVAGTREAYAALFGEDRVDEAMASIGMNELQQIMEEAYQVDGPNSPASPSS